MCSTTSQFVLHRPETSLPFRIKRNPEGCSSFMNKTTAIARIVVMRRGAPKDWGFLSNVAFRCVRSLTKSCSVMLAMLLFISTAHSQSQPEAHSLRTISGVVMKDKNEVIPN